ncbi:MAG: hypothetical protein JXQ23_03890 [Clostridia bacterium]|nr:hypothetical protein [Clostridia bacterium]
MIGYIKTFKPELKVKDLQVYESYYCGICKSLKTRYGLFKNMTLNYDCVFISLLIDALKDTSLTAESFRCAYNPMKKKTRILNQSTYFTSDVNLYLFYKKLKDDFHDERKLVSLIGSLFIKGAGKKAGKRLGKLKDEIDQNLDMLYSLENSHCFDSDTISSCYGKVVQAICSDQFENDKKLFKISSYLGYNVGKWVYLIDAFDDLEKDIKNKSYNPYVLEYHFENETVADFKSRIREKVKTQLYKILDEAVKAYELSDENKYSPIIFNILLEGIYNTTNTVIEGTCYYGKKSI